MVESQKQKLQAYAQKKNIELKTKIEDIFVKVNGPELEKIIFNVLHNAIKFSSQNSEVDIYTDGKNLVIQDYGVGIEKQDLKHIFDRFYKKDIARTISAENGSGLGLSIVKEFAEKNNIKIKVESKVGEGTKFILIF